MFRFLPEQASEVAPKVDWVHNLVTDIAVFFTVGIVGTMLYFAIRYRERDGKPHETPQIRGSHLLEVLWTVVPTLICIVVAYYGIIYYRDLRAVPENALEIQVRAQMWRWDFEYANGKKTTSELVVPVNQPVKLIMRSRDVLHSFFVPTMRTKSDVLPSQYTYVTFNPVKTGEFQVFCTEYCGREHWNMLAKLRVVPQAEYDQWVEDRSEEEAMSNMDPVERGRLLYTGKGCNACHSLDGSRLVGPSFLKLFGKKENVVVGGAVQEITVDENYISESILNPNAKIVEGFGANLMPAFAGQLSEDEVSALIAFIKSVEEAEAPAAAATDTASLESMTPVQRGEHYYKTKLCNTCHSLDGSAVIGPTFKGIMGREEKLADGSTVTVDEAYVKESILNPTAKIVQGFQPVMPPYQGQLDDQALNDIIEYLKTVQ